MNKWPKKEQKNSIQFSNQRQRKIPRKKEISIENDLPIIHGLVVVDYMCTVVAAIFWTIMATTI